MRRRLLSELSDHPEKSRGTVGGNERVARRFLPKCPAAMHIRLDGGSPRRALSRRRLARLIDPRRVVS
jgi:hypothetical protein